MANGLRLMSSLAGVKSLAGVWLREPITLKDVSFAPHVDLQVELSRLERLERQTISLWDTSLTT